jgi:hypothetical protein
VPKITDLTSITSSGLLSSDLIEVVDVSDSTFALTGTNKKTTLTDIHKVSGTTAGSVMFATRVTGDAQDRIQILADGSVKTGDGTSPTVASLGVDSLTLPMVRPGQNLYFHVPTITSGTGNANASFTGTYIPLMVPRSAILTEVGIWVDATAGSANSRIRIALYADSVISPGNPDALIQDFGLLTPTTVNTNLMFTGLSVPLQAYVLYWIFGVLQNADQVSNSVTTAPVVRWSTHIGVWGASAYPFFGGVYSGSGPQSGTGAVLGAAPTTASVTGSNAGSPFLFNVRLQGV